MPGSQTFPLPRGYQHRGHAMPWWLGFVLASPVRRLFENPRKLLAPHVRAGDTALEIGPGMGFHTMALADMVGSTGRVVAVDCQERMVQHLERRLMSRQLDEQVEARLCSPNSLSVADLTGRVDVAVALHVIHEAPDPERMIGELARTLRPGGRLILSEPRGHVDRDLFLWEYGVCREAGLVASDWPRLSRQMVVVLTKPLPVIGDSDPGDLTPAA